MKAGRALALACAVVLCGTGCDRSAAPPRVATASTSTPGGTTASATPPPAAAAGVVAEYVAAQRRWVACMREQGLEVSDPDPTGQVRMPYDNSRKGDPAIVAAHRACRAFQVTVPQEVSDLRLPPLTEAQKEIKRRYSRCMQENGAPDFPDPRPNGYFADVKWNQTGPGVPRATRICAPIIGEPTDPPASPRG